LLLADRWSCGSAPVTSTTSASSSTSAPVISGRHAHLVLDHGALVELGWSPGSRPGPPLRPAEADADQPGFGEPVQVERGERALDADRLRGLVPADATALLRDVLVEPAPHRVVEDRDDADFTHHPHSKTSKR
jgi:hypothetical protein